MSSNVDLVKKTYKYHGLSSVLNLLSLKVVNKVLPLKILNCVLITEIKADTKADDPKFQGFFLDENQIKNFAEDSENELPVKFVESALKRGDECLGIIDDGELAGYGWYSNGDTFTDLHNLKFCFDPAYMYAYKGFTKMEYRGQRLQGLRVRSALNHYHEKGFNGIVYYIESDNYDSLKSCYRMGFKMIGSIVVFKAFGKVYHFNSKSAQQHNVRLSE